MAITGSCHCGSCTYMFDGSPDRATACNCTVCRRYGTLWAYGWVDHGITAKGETVIYMRGEKGIEFHHCPTCGGLMFWRGVKPHEDGRRRIAVNLRMADDPAAVAAIPIHHFDGLDSWSSRPDDGRTVGDMWF